MERFQYFLTLDDDHSIATWICLFQNKNELLSIFLQFIQQVETQFNTRVNYMKSDNPTRIAIHQVLSGESHIVSFHSCPETEQNSVVERKHQHILNISHALMFHSGVLCPFGEIVY